MKAKKIISTILTIAMLLAIVSVSVSAAPLTFGDSATYTITSVAEINPDNFNIKVEVDESKILATDGGSIEYTTVVTSAVVDGIDYYVDPEAFLDIFVQNVGDEAKSKDIYIEFYIEFVNDSVYGELNYDIVITGFSLPATSGGNDIIGGALENIKVATDIKIGGKFADFPSIIESSIDVISMPDRVNFYDTEKFSLEGTVISFELSTGVNATLEYNAETKKLFSAIPSTGSNLTVYDKEAVVFFNGVAIFYAPIQVEHKWSASYVNITTDKYTETKPGYHAIVCEGCGEAKDAQPHNPGEWVYNEDQTFVANGTSSTDCSDCGATLTKDVLGTADYNTAFGDLHFLLVVFDYINLLMRFIGAAVG